MKGLILFLCMAAALAQAPTRVSPTRVSPTRAPLRPEDNVNSMCAVRNLSPCAVGRCLERRASSEHVVTECEMRRMENETCRMDLLEGDDDEEEEERVEESRGERPFKDVARDRAEGGRDRRTARTITGALPESPCAENLRCFNGRMCTVRPTNTRCLLLQRQINTTRCDEEGNFAPLQCRRLRGEETLARPTGLNCYCVNRMTNATINGTMRRVRSKDDLPDCESRSFRGCIAMRNGRRIAVRHGQSVPRRNNSMCMRCRCNDGQFQCRMPDDEAVRCSRADPDDNERPENCMMDGEMVMHNEQREDGKCNRCGCRNGTLQCTRILECRGEDSDSDDSERRRENRNCDECMGMPARPVCAVRDGRTFPTRCHAMMCQGFARDEVEDGPCAERNDCTRERACGANFTCMDIGGETRMTRERNRPEERRLCVNRQELRCFPTMMTADGRRKIIDEENEDPLEELKSDNDDDGNSGDNDDSSDDDDDDDRTVCASDGNSYPSTCHMMVESRGDRVPRVRHRGPCRADEAEETMPTRVTNRTVCGTDGVTYSDIRTMRTRGGNVRVDYVGRCMQASDNEEEDTPMRRCEMVRESRRCPNLTGCARRSRLSDGCCPICGSAVIMAIDQEAMDEHIRVTGELNSVDDFMAEFFRDGGMDMARKPEINSTISAKCDITITRPTTTPGNTTEIVFRAKDQHMDAMICHEAAMEMMRRLNSIEEIITPQRDLVAAAIVAPQEEISDKAPPFAASFVVLLCAYLTTFLL